MKIAMYQPWIYLYGGIERSILELVKRSRHEWTLYAGHYEPQATFPEFSNFNVVELKHLSVKRDMPSVMKVAYQIYRQAIPLKGYDALVIWCDGMGDMAAFKNHSLPLFNICSTPLRAAFDPYYEAHSLSSRGTVGRIMYKLFKNSFRFVDRMAWQKYDGVIATSLEVKNRIIKGNLFREGERLKLYYPGIDWNSFKRLEPNYEPMFLVPGRIMWTKNIELAIKAFLDADLPQCWQLVVAGFLDDKSHDYYASLKNLSSGHNRIRFEISPSDIQLEDLYSRASAILFPPLNEDWGIVPLEAMAFSKPVFANASGGPLESVKDSETGLLLEPSIKAWSHAMTWAADHHEQLKEMGHAARKHSKRYDWSQFVNGVDDAIESWSESIKGA